MNNKPITIFLANDHTIVREGVKRLIHKNPGIWVIGEAESFTEIYERLDGSLTDFLLTDDQMPGGDFPENLTKIKERWPQLTVIVTSLFPPETEHLASVSHLMSSYINTLSNDFERELMIALQQ